MANVKSNARGAISAVCQSVAITKAGTRPANRKAVAAPAICSIRNLSHHPLDRGSVADLLASTPILSERCSALVVCGPSPPVRLPFAVLAFVPGSNVWGMACRSCNSLTVRDGAQGPPLVVNRSTRTAAPKPPSLFLRTPGMDGLKKSDSRFGTIETGLKTEDLGNGRKRRSLTHLIED